MHRMVLRFVLLGYVQITVNLRVQRLPVANIEHTNTEYENTVIIGSDFLAQAFCSNKMLIHNSTGLLSQLQIILAVKASSL